MDNEGYDHVYSQRAKVLRCINKGYDLKKLLRPHLSRASSQIPYCRSFRQISSRSLLESVPRLPVLKLSRNQTRHIARTSTTQQPSINLLAKFTKSSEGITRNSEVYKTAMKSFRISLHRKKPVNASKAVLEKATGDSFSKFAAFKSTLLDRTLLYDSRSRSKDYKDSPTPSKKIKTSKKIRALHRSTELIRNVIDKYYLDAEYSLAKKPETLHQLMEREKRSANLPDSTTEARCKEYRQKRLKLMLEDRRLRRILLKVTMDDP